ncbi:hypothetical protein RJ639_021743 [Escallonia herrerae]|uniref:Transposase (putative) gypsy type domain-containing protein n=1 Tax=Escallonia herrerae TaxID=1293975 RepID=A0AA88V331_9ASTE|nr:hypothetical protein RJ639_021743 [Escallonia herrerae]
MTKQDEESYFTVDEKRNKMSKEELEALLKEFPLPRGDTPRVPGLQEPAYYGTKKETCIYDGQLRSGYTLHLHPFALAMLNRYKMVPCQLVPNGWRKLVGLVYFVKTSGYKADFKDFMKVFFAL